MSLGTAARKGPNVRQRAQCPSVLLTALLIRNSAWMIRHREEPKYSDTSAKEDNSFRNHIR